MAIDMHDEILRAAALKAQIDALEVRYSEAKRNILDEFARTGKKSASVVARDGSTVKATFVQATRLVYSEERLKTALNAKQWAKVTKQVLDKTLLEAAVVLGDVDANVVASCTDQTESAAYAKVSGTLSATEVESVLNNSGAPRVKAKPRRAVGSPVLG